MRSSALLGHSWGVLGSFWPAPGRSWSALGTLLGRLGTLLGVLGPLLANLGGRRAAKAVLPKWGGGGRPQKTQGPFPVYMYIYTYIFDEESEFAIQNAKFLQQGSKDKKRHKHHAFITIVYTQVAQ